MTVRYNNTNPMTDNQPEVQDGKKTFIFDLSDSDVLAIITAKAGDITFDQLAQSITGDDDFDISDYERVEFIGGDATTAQLIKHTLADRESGGEVGRLFEVALSGSVSSDIEVTVTTPIGSDNTITMDDTDDGCLLRWNGYAWQILSGGVLS